MSNSDLCMRKDVRPTRRRHNHVNDRCLFVWDGDRPTRRGRGQGSAPNCSKCFGLHRCVFHHLPSATVPMLGTLRSSNRLRFFKRQVSVGVWRILVRGGAAIFRGGFARRCRSRGCSAMRTSSQVHALSSSMQSHTMHNVGSCALLVMHLCLCIVISTNNSSTTAE